MGCVTTKLCDYTNVPNAQFIAKLITCPEITAESFEFTPGLLNLIYKDQFGGSAGEDASMHLHGFCEKVDNLAKDFTVVKKLCASPNVMKIL
jgi:hypothetical protein